MELKVRVTNLKYTETALVKIGAVFDREVTIRSIYYNQPPEYVLKISESDDGDSLVKLKAKSGGFDYLQDERINNVGQKKEELERKFGVKSVLDKVVRLYKYKGYNLELTTIEGVGDFLVVIGDVVTKDMIIREFEISNPQFITVPFDELPRKT